MSLTPLFKGADMPTKTGRTFTGAWEQFWLDALPNWLVFNDTFITNGLYCVVG